MATRIASLPICWARVRCCPAMLTAFSKSILLFASGELVPTTAAKARMAASRLKMKKRSLPSPVSSNNMVSVPVASTGGPKLMRQSPKWLSGSGLRLEPPLRCQSSRWASELPHFRLASSASVNSPIYMKRLLISVFICIDFYLAEHLAAISGAEVDLGPATAGVAVWSRAMAKTRQLVIESWS